MTIPFSCSSKMWIGVFFTFSAVFQVSVHGAAMSSGLESNCSMQAEVAACASICNQERATCLEFVSISTCACKSTPTEGPYRCEKGDEVEGSSSAEFPLVMAKCEKLAKSYSDVDYFLCSPKYRRNSDFMCVIQDWSEEEEEEKQEDEEDEEEEDEHDIVERAAGGRGRGKKNKNRGNKNKGKQSDKQKMMSMMKYYSKAMPSLTKKLVLKSIGVYAFYSNKAAKIVKVIPKLLKKGVNFVTKSGNNRGRRSIEL